MSYLTAVVDAGWEQRGLNNEDLGLGLEINGDLRLSNRGLMKKSGSLGGAVAPAAPPLDPPLHAYLNADFPLVLRTYVLLSMSLRLI